MAFDADFEKQNITNFKEEEEDLGVVEFEGELISALDNLKEGQEKEQVAKRTTSMC